MIISRTHGVAFIHIPRTGGTSLRQSLTDRWDDAGGGWEPKSPLADFLHGHAYAIDAKERVPDWAGLHSFAFVRNPWDWLVSCWSKFGGGATFDEYVENPRLMWQRLPRQSDWVFDRDGRQLVREVCRFETFERDFTRLSQRWGSSLPPPHLNASDHEPYREYYTPALRDKVADLFAADIAAFGYQWRG